jgi:hypothetical protein
MLDQKQKLVRKYASYIRPEFRSQFKNEVLFEGLPVSEAKQLLTGLPNIDPQSAWNSSPSYKEMITLAEQYSGYLGGEMITDPKYAEIRLDTIFLPIDAKTAVLVRYQLCKPYRRKTKKNPINDHCPDEVKPYSIGNIQTYKFWWD